MSLFIISTTYTDYEVSSFYMVRFHAYVLHMRDIGPLFSLTSYALGMRKFKNCIPQGRVPQKQEKIKETHNVKQLTIMPLWPSTRIRYHHIMVPLWRSRQIRKKKLLLKDDIHNKTAPAAIFATTGPANFKFQNLQLRTYISFKILLLRY